MKPMVLLAAIGACLGTDGCFLPIGIRCEEMNVFQIDAPARAKRGEAVTVVMHWSAGQPFGDPGATASVDDAARVVTFAATACEGGLPRAYPAAVVSDATFAATFTPRATGLYTIRLRGTPPTATVLVEE